MKQDEIAYIIKEEAIRIGFDSVGFTRAELAHSAQHYLDWIAEGYHGEMAYLARTAAQRLDPRNLLPAARSVIVVGLNYAPGELTVAGRGVRVSCYAWGEDYHSVMRSRMKDLCRRVRERTGLAFAARICVDTAPLLEREFAQRAGLGWIGKNTNLTTRRFGVWLFLGVILVDFDLPPDEPARDRCGTCRRCIQACPTGALIGPRLLDARRCISYLTVELKGAIPRDLRPAIGGHLFGCDECLAVCPWNRFALPTAEPRFACRNHEILFDPERILTLSEEELQRRFASSPVSRIGRRGLARNAAVVLGNLPELGARSLCEALSDREPVVRQHAAWALGRRAKEMADRALNGALQAEEDADVRSEIRKALESRAGEPWLGGRMAQG
jgi:epoxyqueuosine reductase